MCKKHLVTLKCCGHKILFLFPRGSLISDSVLGFATVHQDNCGPSISLDLDCFYQVLPRRR